MDDLSKWDVRYLALADSIAGWSKDPSTKVGCVIVGEAGQVLATGYNGFPRGVSDSPALLDRHRRPDKYKWTEHSERNALYNAARTGVAVCNATAYVTWFPCVDCMRGLIQSGIACIVTTYYPDFKDERWGDDFKLGFIMMTEARMGFRFSKH